MNDRFVRIKGVVFYKDNFTPDNWERLNRGMPLVMPPELIPKKPRKNKRFEAGGEQFFMAKKTVDFEDSKMDLLYHKETGIMIIPASLVPNLEEWLGKKVNDCLDELYMAIEVEKDFRIERGLDARH